MRFYYFKILILCVLLPPMMYVLTLQFSEHYLRERKESEIRDIYMGDIGTLLEGSEKFRDVINRNITRYLESDPFVSLGGRIHVTVTTSRGMLLYPDGYMGDRPDFSRRSTEAVAEENYALMMDAKLGVDVTIDHHSLFAMLVLFAHMGVFSFLFYIQYRAGFVKVYREDLQKKKQITDLKKSKKKYDEKLYRLEKKRAQLMASLSEKEAKLKEAALEAIKNEDDYIEEIAALEEKISNDLAVQQGQQQLITDLLDKIEAFEKNNSRQSGPKKRLASATRKRFATLYKNTVLHEKAINGYVNLTDELKLKSEEVIHKLNEDPDTVQIKRKVFGRKNRETVLEVLFGYKGRLYFRRNNGDKPEVLVIGTKNTQVKDLEFLDKFNR